MSEFTEHIIACSGIKLKEYEGDFRYIELQHLEGSKEQNVNLHLNTFVTKIYKLNNRLKDLLEIAGYVFAADRKTYRGKSDDLEYHSWSRAFNFHIKVRDLNFWKRKEIQELLENALMFMSGDHSYKFNFYQAEEDFPTSIFDNEKFEVQTPEKLKVALYSGGIDSLAGAIETLETTDSEICLVSHQSGQPGTIMTQRVIFEQLKSLYPDRCNHYKFHCGLHGIKSKDETQRTRSFLYCSTAFAIAKTYQQDCIYVYENGITSLNFSETQDLMNARSSRTTHPQTLSRLEELFKAIAEEDFHIHNPFLFKTKTEVAEVIKTNRRLDLFDTSVSCSVTRNKERGNTHCGKCSQCIDRRFAVYAAGIEKYDDNGLYHFDFLQDDLIDDDIKKALTDYIRLANKWAKQDIDSWWEERSLEILEIIDFIKGESEQDKMTQLYDLCFKHSQHIEAAIKRMRDLYDSPLSPVRLNSFFNLIIGPRVYQKETEKPSKGKPPNEIEIPPKQLKKFAKETCEALIKEKKITEVLTETKTKRNISNLIVKELKRKRYKLTPQNENTISDYFRKLELHLKKKKTESW
ncbi:MAG: 7-cyano-7-deazaguanine synthase [Ignavibacteriaceae bacterium]|nr:7-cyano-7-deazaguanine synthase [Ignavibacteriaceae bacterium]